MSTTQAYDVLRSAMLAGLLLWTGAGLAQDTASSADASTATSLNDSVRELRQQIRELQAAVTEIRSESQSYRAETTELRRELEAVRSASAGNSPGPAESVAASSAYAPAVASQPGVQEDQKMEHAATGRRAVRVAVSAGRCGSRRLDWRFLVRSSPAREQKRTCSWIWEVDFHGRRMV